jgi:hypothetical protein
MNIKMYQIKRIRVLKDITWYQERLPNQTLPAGWEGRITRYRRDSASALLDGFGEFVIRNCFLREGCVEEIE